MNAATEIISLEGEIKRRDERIKLLEDYLLGLIDTISETLNDSEGRWPQPNTGCIECTYGTVPDRLNTGKCNYHKAKELLGLK